MSQEKQRANVFKDFEYEISPKELVDVLRKGGVIGGTIRSIIVDKTVSDIKVSEREINEELAKFKMEHELDLEDKDKYDKFLHKRQINNGLMREIVCRLRQIEIFKEEKWGSLANSLYIKNRDKYNTFTFKMIDSDDANKLQEAYFRLKDDKEEWETVAQNIFGKSTQKSKILEMSCLRIDKVLSALEDKRRYLQASEGKGSFVIMEPIKKKCVEYNNAIKKKIMTDGSKYIDEKTQKLSSIQYH